MYVNNVDIACSTCVDSGACLINHIKKNMTASSVKMGRFAEDDCSGISILDSMMKY
jgi:hypothetical protein